MRCRSLGRLGVAGVLVAACGGETAQPPSPNDGVARSAPQDSGAVFGSRGSAGAGSGVSSDAMPGVSPDARPGANDVPADPADEACVGVTVAADLLPVDLLLLLDRSPSMGEPLVGDSDESKWASVLSAVRTFAYSPEGSGHRLGVQYFAAEPEACLPDAYAAPIVPLGPLPDVASAVVTSIEQHDPAELLPVSRRPTYPALLGSLRHMSDTAIAEPLRAPAVVLISDGLPNECSPTSACPDCSTAIHHIVDLATRFRDGESRVSTYVISLGAELLGPIGRADGPRDAFVITDGNVEEQVLEALHDSIYPPAGKCLYDIPAPPGGQRLDLDAISVRVALLGGEAHLVPEVSAQQDCALNRNEGWYFDDPADPEGINLCPESCEKSARGTLTMAFGCVQGGAFD